MSYVGNSLFLLLLLLPDDLGCFLQYSVGQAVVDRLARIQPEIPVAVLFHLFGRLAGMLGQYFIKTGTEAQYFLGLDIQIGGRSDKLSGD